jgi:2-dehydro-3-deoxygluconokinase
VSDVVTFGEALMRFSTDPGTPFREARKFDMHIGGTELNVAVNSSCLGLSSSFVSVIADGAVGDQVLARIHDRKVDTRWVKRAEGSQGVYFVERAAAPRTYEVLKRQAGAIAEQKELGLNWSEALKGAKIFFTTGITAALSPVCLNEIKKAFSQAKSLGVKTAFDFNYRSKMWSKEDAKRAYTALVGDVDILFGSASDLKEFLGLDPQKDKLPWNQVVLSDRSEDQKYSVTYIHNGERLLSRAFPFQTIDRIGIGDAMAAGFIYGELKAFPPQKKADFAAAAGAVKYSIEGDWNLADAKVIEQVLSTNTGGIIR